MSVRCGLGFRWYSVSLIITMMIVFLHGGYVWMESPKEERLVLSCAEVPAPVFTSLPDLTADEMLLEAMDDSDSSDSSISSSSSMTAAASSLIAKPKPFSQGQLNDLVRDLGLSKKSSEILASRLGEHGMLYSRTNITFYRDRDDLWINSSLWKITLFVTTTSKASFQKWVFQSATQMNEDCL